MMRIGLWPTMALLALSAAAAADELPISAGAIDNLGIRLVAPERASEVAVTQGTARVVIPPAGDAVVGTPQAGLLTGLNVAVGDDVVSGQVLAELRSPEFLSLQREFLDALNTHRLAQSELKRDRQLNDEGIVSARRLEETTTRSRIAEAGLNEHRQLLRIAGLDGGDVRSLETRQVLLESLRIRAPFNGVIVERFATTGQRVDALSPIYRIADLSELWLEIAVPQERVQALRPGMTVTDSNHMFDAEITAIGRAIDPTTQSVTVRARITEGADLLNPGQVIGVQIVRDSETLAGGRLWTVPAAAVTRSGGRTYVFVRTAGGFDVREVEVIGIGENLAYLEAQLHPGDLVAASGIPALKSLWTSMQESESP